MIDLARRVLGWEPAVRLEQGLKPNDRLLPRGDRLMSAAVSAPRAMAGCSGCSAPCQASASPCGFCLCPLAGCVYKADTNVTREAPAIRICHDLLDNGSQLAIFDPKVSEAQFAINLGAPSQLPRAGEALSCGGVLQLAPSAQAAASGSEAVLILTEWAEFAALDWWATAAVMRHPAWLFDARANADAAAAREAGLNVWTVGKG